MKISLFVLAVSLASIPAAAAAQNAGGPPIAYIKGTSEIYLSNESGTGITKLYTAPRKTSLRWLDLKPGGNEVAFMQGLSIRIQKFHDSGQANGSATAIPGAPCAYTQSPDYHPSGDGRFVFIAACGFGNFQVMTYKAGDSGPTALFTVNSANRIRWSRTGEHLMYDEADSRTSSTKRLKRRDVATGAVDDFGTISDLSTFDITRTHDRLAFGAPRALKLIDFATMTDTAQAEDLGCEGDDLHFDSTDWTVVYESPPAKQGTYILYRPFNHIGCGGSAGALTGKGNWGSKDWRPNPVTP